MARKASPPANATALTLSDADITSQRVTRRSLLGTLGLGAGVAAAAAFGAAEIAHADAGTKKKAPPKKPAGKKAAPKKKAPEADSD